MVNYYDLVNKVIKEADILLLVIDARRVKESINKDLEYKIQKMGKKFLYVINKVDLITEAEQDQIVLPFSIQISAKEHMSTMVLLRKIMALVKGESAVVGVIGFPNTGKSTLINALKGRHSASTSSVSGHTKSLQKIRISKKLQLIDTPGVFARQQDHAALAQIGSINPEKMKDPEGTVMELITQLDGKVEAFFGVKKNEDPNDTLEAICHKKNILRKGGLPDTSRMAKQLLVLIQKGEIG